MREKPYSARAFLWEEFEKWADENDIGEAKEDWLIWWECFEAGSKAGKEYT